MGIVFRHDAAAVALPSTSGSRKYGQQLVLQQQQQKYDAQQAGYDRMFQLGRDQQQYGVQAARDIAQQAFVQNRDRQQNDFMMGRDKAQFEQQQQMMEAERQRKFMEDARKQSSGMIMQDIQEGAYDPATARKLQQNLVAESEVLGNPQLDATQRAEGLQKLRAERALLSANRMEKPPALTPQERFNQSIVTGQDGTQYLPNAKGGYDPIKQQEQKPPAPASAEEAFRADPKVRKDYMEQAIEMETEGGDKKLTPKLRQKAAETAKRNYEQDYGIGTPTDAPELPASQSPVAGQSKSILETAGDSYHAGMTSKGYKLMTPTDGTSPYYYKDAAPGNSEDAFHAGMTSKGYKLITPPEGQGSPFYYKDAAPPVPQVASRPDAGMPPSPTVSTPATAPTTQPQAAPAPQKVNVGGKPLTVTPGTLTPQETEARQQIMSMPREQRIEALLPHDPQMNGRTLKQVLEDPETKAQYDELTKQGLTTGNYEEDMLSHLDEMLQNNVLNSAGTPQEAYVGMRADEVTDPKAKAEVAKMPRPKSPEEMNGIRGPYFIDPDGIIRSTKKQ